MTSKTGFASIALFVLGAVGAPRAHAQRPPQQLDAARILHEMQKLDVLGSVLYVAAHPDDENTRLISWLANGRKVRTGYLSLTRGDGGQNLIGPELGDGLGIIRTQELLEARRIDGGEQFFTRAVDFGFSKSAEESFAKWGKAEVLGDVVRVIRKFRPDVIITRFDTDGSGGHGHHTASSILAHEAFSLAADATAYPEQIASGLAPWQARRLLFNASTWWKPDLAQIADKDPTRWMHVDVGGFDPLLGLSYTELAARSRSQHKSQGFGTAETRGETLEYLRADLGAPLADADMFAGLDTTWTRVRGGDAIQRALAEMRAAYDPNAPETSIRRYIELVLRLDALAASDDPERAWAAHKAAAARRLIWQACGAGVEVTASVPRIAVGQSVPVTITTLQRRPGDWIALESVLAPGGGITPLAARLSTNKAQVDSLVFDVRGDGPIDEPYWLARPHEGLFHAGAGAYSGIEPASRAVATFATTSKWDGTLRLSVDRALMTKWTDRVAGERTRAVAITPIASVSVLDPVVLVRGERAKVSVEIEALRDDLSGALELTLAPGWTLATTLVPIEHARLGERRKFDFELLRAPSAAACTLRAAFDGPAGRADRTLRTIDYPHILPQTWYTPAEIALVPLDVSVDVRTIGYIDGAGDEIPAALRRLGLVVERIDPTSARSEDLDACDAIVTGIRAYNTTKALARFQPQLLAYVERGGTLIVQYNTNGADLVMKAQDIGPRPFSISRERVTVEDAEPTFLVPDHPLLRSPNAITQDDFHGWVQERGLYFASELDPSYTALIAWNDPGEKPNPGALIACDHGQGRFVYTGLSLFRQLPAGVPGAYRLLANLVARRTKRS